MSQRLPDGYRWMTADEADWWTKDPSWFPEALLVPGACDGGADLALPIKKKRSA